MLIFLFGGERNMGSRRIVTVANMLAVFSFVFMYHKSFPKFRMEIQIKIPQFCLLATHRMIFLLIELDSLPLLFIFIGYATIRG